MAEPNWSESEFSILRWGSVRVASVWLVSERWLIELFLALEDLGQIFQVPCLLIVVQGIKMGVSVHRDEFPGYIVLALATGEKNTLSVSKSVYSDVIF